MILISSSLYFAQDVVVELLYFAVTFGKNIDILISLAWKITHFLNRSNFCAIQLTDEVQCFILTKRRKGNQVILTIIWCKLEQTEQVVPWRTLDVLVRQTSPPANKETSFDLFVFEKGTKNHCRRTPFEGLTKKLLLIKEEKSNVIYKLGYILQYR